MFYVEPHYGPLILLIVLFAIFLLVLLVSIRWLLRKLYFFFENSRGERVTCAIPASGFISRQIMQFPFEICKTQEDGFHILNSADSKTEIAVLSISAIGKVSLMPSEAWQPNAHSFKTAKPTKTNKQKSGTSNSHVPLKKGVPVILRSGTSESEQFKITWVERSDFEEANNRMTSKKIKLR